MTDAVLWVFQTYVGLALVWPVVVVLLARFAARRYGPAIGRDVRRVARPAFALLILAVPFLIDYPFIGVVIFGIWIAYCDHELKSGTETER